MKKKTKKPAVHETLSAAAVTSELRTIHLGEGLVAFHERVQISFPPDAPKNLARLAKDESRYGITKEEDVQAYLHGDADNLNEIRWMCYATSEFLERTARLSLFWTYNETPLKSFGKDDFEAAEKGEMDIERLVVADVSNMLLYDRNGNVLPIGIKFDYANGWLDNAHYDLNVAKAILDADKRVTAVDRYVRKVLKRLEIASIPGHYDDDATSTLNFYFSPTKAEMDKLFADVKSKGAFGWDMLRKAVIDQDLLGHRAGGAEKHHQQ